MIMESDDSDNEADICILPPMDGAQSDCEHIDEDDLAPVEPADVCGEVEVFFDSTKSVGPNSEDDREEQEHYNVIQQRATRKRSRTRQPKTPCKTGVVKRACTKRRRTDEDEEQDAPQALAEASDVESGDAPDRSQKRKRIARGRKRACVKRRRTAEDEEQDAPQTVAEASDVEAHDVPDNSQKKRNCRGRWLEEI